MVAAMLTRPSFFGLVFGLLLGGMGCRTAQPVDPMTVELPKEAGSKDGSAEPLRQPQPSATSADLAPRPTKDVCATAEPKRIPCHLIPRCSGEYGRGGTPREKDCHQLLWFGFWTQEAMNDPHELIALGGILSDLIHANDEANLTSDVLTTAVAKYRASLLAEQEDATALARAICQGDSSKKDYFRGRLSGDMQVESQARETISSVCNH